MPPVIHQLLDGEVIVVNLDSGVYYSLLGAAAEIWAAVDGGASSEEAVDELLVRYDAPRSVVETAVRRFVAELEQDALIVAADAAEPQRTPASANGTPRLPFEAPVLDKYTDMQELLLLDPIHEVGEAGWPHTLAGDTQPA